MSDIVFTPASFNTAYRAYSVEQGHDVGQAQQAAADVADQNAGAVAMAEAEAQDAVFISPQAARLFAAQVEREKAVRAMREAQLEREATGRLASDRPSAFGGSPAAEQPAGGAVDGQRPDAR